MDLSGLVCRFGGTHEEWEGLLHKVVEDARKNGKRSRGRRKRDILPSIVAAAIAKVLNERAETSPFPEACSTQGDGPDLDDDGIGFDAELEELLVSRARLFQRLAQ
jgi:hypothetical protein